MHAWNQQRYVVILTCALLVNCLDPKVTAFLNLTHFPDQECAKLVFAYCPPSAATVYSREMKNANVLRGPVVNFVPTVD